MPDGTEGVLVCGGSVGTLTALAAAAHGAVDDRDQATAYVQEHTHAAVAKAWRILGFNPANLRVLRPIPATACNPPRSTRRCTSTARPGLEPFAVIGTAGTTSTGSVDPLNDLADLAEREGLWFHVDGAYGAPARLTPARRGPAGGHRARGQPRAGPAQVALPALRDRRGPDPAPGPARSKTFTLDGAYLRDTKGGVVEFRERGPQLTRGSRALKLWLSLRTFGLDAFKDGDRHGHRARRARRGDAAQRPRVGGRLARDAGVVCFRRRGHDDAQTDAMVRARGRATATPRRARRSSTAARSRGCARSTRAPPSATSRRRSSGSSASALRGPGGPAHRRPSLLQVPLLQPEAGLVRTEREVGRGRSSGGP